LNSGGKTEGRRFLENSDLEEKTKSLVIHLASHRERRLKASFLKERLRNLETPEIVEILNRICTGANAKDPPYLDAYTALPDLLRSLLLNRELIAQIRAVARSKDYFEVFQMLIDLPAQKSPSGDPKDQGHTDLQDLTLGARISLAKSSRQTVLRKLLREQEPRVIRTLLQNPCLTESDVLKIASLQPTAPAILQEIFQNPKWVARYRMKKALIYNPYCPPAIAVHLLKFLLFGDLKEIAQQEGLHLAVKEAVHQLLQEKS
jgi:hypothetical protein